MSERIPLWGKETSLSLKHFAIGHDKMPTEIVRALIVIKKCAAVANNRLGKLPSDLSQSITVACDKLLSHWDKYACEFPLSIWQTGSGTQTNMNVNEVVSALCLPVCAHPNDHVNMSQSTNDAFPSAIQIAMALMYGALQQSLNGLIDELSRLEAKYSDTKKTGRTHLMDATPMTFGQEISGWIGIIETAFEMLDDSVKYLLRLPLGGTAVGTGINAPAGFGREICGILSAETGLAFIEDINKFHGLSSKDALQGFHGALTTLASGLLKIANDIRWLASGPRTGLSELLLPSNEAGSSIMPGKVNPTQCEALSMIAAEVIGNNATVAFAASQGNFQLNVYMPVIGFKVTESLRLLTDGVTSFTKNCVSGMVANEDVMQLNFENNLMRATALSPVIGYDKTAEIVKTATERGLTLKEAATALGYISATEFDSIVN